MKKESIIIIVCILIVLACKQKSGKTLNDSDLKTFDSIAETKYHLKESIIKHSFNMPYSEIGKGNDKNSTLISYFTVLDSLILLYESEPLTSREQDLLSILKAKNYFVLSKYQEGIEAIKSTSKSGELGYEKKTLLAILYDYKGDTVMSKVVLKDLLSDLKEMDESSEMCEKYFMLKAVFDLTDSYDICKGFNNPFKSKTVDKNYIVINNILTPSEL